MRDIHRATQESSSDGVDPSTQFRVQLATFSTSENREMNALNLRHEGCALKAHKFSTNVSYATQLGCVQIDTYFVLEEDKDGVLLLTGFLHDRQIPHGLPVKELYAQGLVKLASDWARGHV